jgi:N6-L-threonylcarbamoyladenine synthase
MENINDICLHTIYHCRNLDGQIKISCKETGINQIAIGGGVSANSGIRKP